MNKQPENLYNYDAIDWSMVLNPTPQARNKQDVERAMLEDILNLTESVNQGRNPAENWSETNLARATGLPQSAIMNDKESAMAIVYQNALAGKVQENMPYIRGEQKIATDMFHILSSGESAAIVTDKHIWEMGKIQRGFGEKMSHSLTIGNLQEERRQLLWNDALGASSPESNRRIDHLDRYIGLHAETREDESLLTGMWNSTVEYVPQFRDMTMAAIEGAATGMVAGAGIGGIAGLTAGTVIPGAGNVAGGLAGAASGGMTGIAVGGKVRLAYFAYQGAVSEIWGSIRNFKDEYGNTIDPTTARMISFLGAIPVAGLDMVSMGKVMEFVPGLDKFVSKGAVQATAEFIKKNPTILQHVGDSARKGLTALGTEMVTEGLQEGVVVIAEEIAKNTSHLDMPSTTAEEAFSRMIDEAKEAGQTFAIPTAAGIGGRAFVNRKIQQAQRNTDTLEQLHTVAKESETLQHLPEVAQDFQRRLSEDGGLSEVYVKPEAIQRVFFQSEAGIAQAEALGITPESLAESMTLETDIVIPMDLAMAHLLSNETLFNELAPDMKIEADTLTAREADALASGDETATADMGREENAFLDSIFDGLEEEIAISQKRHDMAAPYVEQLVNAGYTKRQAEHLSTLPIAHAEVMAPMFNQTSEEYLAQRFGGFVQTTQAMMDKTEASFIEQERRQFNTASLAERDPLLALVHGRLDGADLKHYDPLASKELRSRHGVGLFKKKGQGGLPLDWLADEAVTAGLLPQGSGANELLAALQDRRRYFQPLNPDVNLEKPIAVVTAEKETAPIWQSMKGADKKAIVDSIVGELRNEATGETIELSRKNASHLISSATARGVGGQPHVAAVRNVKELMRIAERIESYFDRKQQEDIAKMHRYFAPLEYDGDIYAVNMAVKEYGGERVLELDGVHKLYDLKLEKKTPVLLADTPVQQGNLRLHPTGVLEITIRQMLEGVKDGEGNFFFQHKGNSRGAIDFTNPQAVIYLFKGKNNLSTVIHESGHFFLNNLSEAAQLENAPEWVKSSWETVQHEYNFTDVTIPEEAHERFARDFEAYARDGKAPSSYLETAFRQFSHWLVRLYRSVRSLVGAEDISAGIRNVFDRLLATEQEIEAAQAYDASRVSLDTMEEAGVRVSPELKNTYAQAVAEAHSKAEAAIAARRLVEQRAMEKEFTKEAEVRVAHTPFYMHEQSIREQGGIRWESVLESIDEDLAEELRRKWSVPFAKAFFKESGAQEFVDVAARFDVDTPHALAGLLLSTPTRKEAIAADVQRSLAEWNKNFEGSIEYSNSMDEVLALELEAVTGKKQPSARQLRKALEERIGIKKNAVVDAEYKALKHSLQKQSTLLKGIMREVQGEKRSLKSEAKQAFNDGVVAGEMHEGAKRAKERTRWQERLAELKAQERAKRMALSVAYKSRMERDTLTRQIRKVALSKSIHDGHKQQILALIGHWRKLGTPSMVARDLESVVSLREFVGQHESLFGEVETLFPDWLLDEGTTPGEKGLGQLSLEEMRDIHRTITILGHQGRSYNKMLSFKKDVQLTEAAGEMIASMDKAIGKKYLSERDRASFQGKITSMFRGTVSELTAMRYVFDALDGYVNKGGKDSQTGASHKYIISQFQQAQDKENKTLREYDRKLTTSLKKLARPDMKKAFVIEGVPLAEDVAREWGGMFTHEKVVSVALNMGNEGNIKALKKGYGWSDADLQTITSRLTSEELQAVQEVWNIIDELYPLINETHQTMNGVPLAKVAAESVSFQGKDGGVELDGGYYPLVFDHVFSRKAEEFQNTDELINRNEGVLRSAKPKSGMTKERKGGTLPPRLSLSVVRQHLTDSIHYATHAPALSDIYRITKIPEYRSAFIRAAGLEAYNELTPWLRFIARPEGEQVTRIDRTIEWMAKRGTLYVLAFNMKSAFLQLSSMGNSILEVGGAQFMKGAYQILKHPYKTFHEVKEKSAYMESRGRLLDASLREWIDQFRLDGATGVSFMGKTYTLEQVRNAQFAFIQGLDAVVAYPTWIGAYDAAIASGMAEVDAIQRGNEAVIRAQGSGGYMDVTKIQRRRGVMKAFTVFTSFALNDFNRKKYYTAGFIENMRGGHSAINFATYAQHLALEWVAPVVFSAMMLSLGRDGELPDAEDYFWEATGFYSMGIPIFRDAVYLAESQFTGKGYGRGMGGSVAFAGIESGVKAAQSGWKAVMDDDERAQERFIREFTNTMGFVIGVGTPQYWRSMDGAEAYFVDGEGGVLAPFLGKPQKKKN